MGKNHLKVVAAATIVAALGLASCTGVSPSSLDETRYAVIDHLIACNVAVMYPTGVGSGVVYRKNGKHYVITASHVIVDETVQGECPTFGTKPILICSMKQDGNEICFASPGKLVFVDPENDFAILEFQTEPTNEVQVCQFYFGNLRIGDRVYAVGNSSLDINSISTGIVQHSNRNSVLDKTDRKFIQTNCSGGPGLSGGGLYLENGMCIGIVILKNESSQSMYAMPITKIREIVSQTANKDIAP